MSNGDTKNVAKKITEMRWQVFVVVVVVIQAQEGEKFKYKLVVGFQARLI